jgi:uncharacterized OB-fold protein
MAITRADFPLPDSEDALSAPFYEAAAEGELRIPRCDTCGEYVWYPEPACPRDGGALTWTSVSGRGTLFSWVVVHRAFLPAFADKVPFVTALVALAEDPNVRIPTYIVDSEPDTLQPDAAVGVVFRDLAFSTVPGKFVTVPMFTPDAR